MKEIWKSLDGIVENGKNYEVSTFGNVRSIRADKILSPFSPRGYLAVHLYSKQKRKAYLIHRLVALAFLPNPENKPEVNHKDGVKTNNKLDNLEWSTYSENQLHAYSSGLQKVAKGEDRKINKLTEKNVVEIKKLLSDNTVSQKEIADKFGVTRSAIQSIQVGKTWSHVKVEGFTPFIREKTSVTKLDREAALEIRRLYATGKYTMSNLGKKFNVTSSMINNIVHFKRYKDIV